MSESDESLNTRRFRRCCCDADCDAVGRGRFEDPLPFMFLALTCVYLQFRVHEVDSRVRSISQVYNTGGAHLQIAIVS